MKCPLMLTYDVEERPCEHPQPMDCLKGVCAWWSTFLNECAIATLALELNHTRHALQNIASKIPLGILK